jgi:hypothetical protein
MPGVTTTKAQEPRAKLFAALAAFICLAASVGAFALLGQMTDHFEAQYDGLDLTLPGATKAVIALGPYLRHPACPVIVVLACLLPYVLGARGTRAARGYLLATAAVVIATAGAVRVLHGPLRALEESIAPVRTKSR